MIWTWSFISFGSSIADDNNCCQPKYHRLSMGLGSCHGCWSIVPNWVLRRQQRGLKQVAIQSKFCFHINDPYPTKTPMGKWSFDKEDAFVVTWPSLLPMIDNFTNSTLSSNTTNRHKLQSMYSRLHNSVCWVGKVISRYSATNAFMTTVNRSTVFGSMASALSYRMMNINTRQHRKVPWLKQLTSIVCHTSGKG